MSQSNSELVNTMFVESCNELFSNYGLSREIEMSAASPGDVYPDSTMCCLLSATGEGINVVSMLQPDDGFLTNLYPGDKDSVSQQEIEDWCGELNNQLVGRLKNKLLGYQCEVMLGLPSMVTGQQICAAGPKDAMVTQGILESDNGRIKVVAATKLEPELVLEAREGGDDDVMMEGEISLF